MKIHFLGANHNVTGSKHLIEINGHRILLDCGMFQGKRKESYELNKNFPAALHDVDAVILSHAHIDHSGSLPILVKNGYSGPIHCTIPSKDVVKLMLLDAAHIQEMDAEYVAKKEKEMSPTIPIAPLYTIEDAEKTNSLLAGHEYHIPFEVFPGITCTFLDAGHILGSSVVILDCEEGGNTKRLTFSGDIGRKGKIILRDPEPPKWSNYLITESTYGARTHPPFALMRTELERIINETVKRGGKIIIPSFALERAQEIIYDLHVLYKQDRVPAIPVYVDSPLAAELTNIFAEHPDVFDENTRTEFLEDNVNPFSFSNLKFTKSVDESKALNSHQGPCIIISASGMCEFGRIRHHLVNNIEDPQNTILIVGYQAEYTLGKRIVERRPFVKILGQMYKLRAKVEVLNGYSGHGDTNDLVEFICSIDKLSHVFIVHGETSQSDGLASRLRKTHRKWTLEIPEMGDVIDPEEITYEGH